MPLQKSWWISLIGSLLFSNVLWAAACCGGGSSSPAVLLGDEKMQFSSSYSSGRSFVENVDSKAYWHKAKNPIFTENVSFAISRIFRDRWQWGLQLPRVKKSNHQRAFQGFGDMRVHIGYEYLTNWSYHPWKPKGVGYISYTSPAGATKFESSNAGMDVFGKGFRSLAVGSILTKNWVNWDLQTSLELRTYFSKQGYIEGVSTHMEPKPGASFGLALGYNFTKLRVSSGVDWIYEGEIVQKEVARNHSTAFERYANLTLAVNYPWDDLHSLGFSYVDQTVLGSPINTSLSKSLQVSFRKIWQR